jgi:hypothetical protein
MSDYAEKRRIQPAILVAAENTGSFSYAIQALACFADDIITIGKSLDRGVDQAPPSIGYTRSHRGVWSLGITGVHTAMQDASSAKDVARQLRDWMNSEVGRRELGEMLSKADQSTADLDHERQLDPASLQEHFTL